MKIEFAIDTILLDMDGVLVDDLDMYFKASDGFLTKDTLDLLNILGQKQEIVFPYIHKAIQDNLFLNAKITAFGSVVRDILLPKWISKGIKVEILSSLMKDNPYADSLLVQKQAWLYDNGFGNLPAHFVKGSAKKQEFAKAGTLLIDDYDRNIAQFIKAGGYALQYRLSGISDKLQLLDLI